MRESVLIHVFWHVSMCLCMCVVACMLVSNVGANMGIGGLVLVCTFLVSASLLVYACMLMCLC